MCLSLGERYIPRAFDIPMNVGLRWLPQWSSSPVRDSAAGVSGKERTPFHRMIWELLSVSLWDKAVLCGAQGRSPSAMSRLWPFKKENLDWASRYITPIFSYFYFPRTIYPQKGEDSPDLNSFPWSVYHQVEDVESIYCQAAAVMTSLLTFSLKECREMVKGHRMDDDGAMVMYPVGHLGFKEEGMFC